MFHVEHWKPRPGLFHVEHWARDDFGRFSRGGSAVAAARANKPAMAVIRAMDETPRIRKGTGLRLVVSKRKDLAAIRTLTPVKLAN